jgi:hypothetical protein
MTDSTKRILRTCLQVLAALVVVTPMLVTFLAGTPIAAQVGTFAAAVAAVAAVVNKLEDAGVLPPWLKGDGNVDGSDTDA